ncbi:MAG: MarR family winged helix-turn-helix transcriptional regulator [Candidatus Sumerlaeaceae bacterium]
MKIEMVSRLANELKIRTGFQSLEQEAFLQILRTADHLATQAGDLLKEHDLSSTSYNVLRILRGAGAKGLACGEISDRLITRVPDVTRLLDRLELKALVARTRLTSDRRVVLARITQRGLRILSRIDEPMAALHQQQFAHMRPEELGKLCALLESVRALTGAEVVSK